MWPGISLGVVVVFRVTAGWFWTTSLVPGSPGEEASGPKSGNGRETVRTSWTLSRTSKVLISWKPWSARTSQVLWTCSMHGEKEQRRPPEDRHKKIDEENQSIGIFTC